MKTLNNHLLVKPFREETTASGIIVASSNQTLHRATVEVGTETVPEGSIVYFRESDLIPCGDMYFIREDLILAVE